jgi:glyceraldehyde 3-phosphate dehydrogenase
MMTTIHSYTGDQPTLDTMHKDLYRARAAALSQIPTSTGAAKAVGLVLPELKGKLDGISIRVPTPNVSVVDLKFVAKRNDHGQEVNAAIKAAAEGPLKGILAYTNASAVSIDFNHDPHSSTIALDQTKVMDGNLVSVLSWYDNEWGFSNRMGDTALYSGFAPPQGGNTGGEQIPLREKKLLNPFNPLPFSRAGKCSPPLDIPHNPASSSHGKRPSRRR